jgi:hypothetical protein
MERERLDALARSDPEGFKNLIDSVAAKVVQPHPGQKLVLENQARFKIMNCGRRWGKTKLAAKMLLQRSRKPKQMLWWVAPTYKVVKRGYAEVLRQIPDGVLEHEPPPETNFDSGRQVILRFKNGTKIEFYSAERPEGMLGEGVDYAVLDEAATMPARIWNQIVSPTLMDRKGGALLISTPRGRNWFYKAWQMGQDAERTEWASWTFPSDSNPHLPEGEVERFKFDMPRLEYEQEVEAKFLAAGSSTFVIPQEALQHDKVLPNFFVKGISVKGHQIVLGIDLARTNDWTVIYGARARDRKNCYFERMQAITWPEQKRRIKRAVGMLMRAGASGVMLVMDSTGVGDPIYEDIEAAGYDVVGINFTTNKANMVKLLAKDIETASAFLLEERLNEFEDYAMSVTPGGRWTFSAPEGDNDDAVSAKMLQHHGLVNEGVPDFTILSPDGPTTEREKLEPWEEDEEDFSDLIDPEDDKTEALEIRQPSPAELLANPNAWL